MLSPCVCVCVCVCVWRGGGGAAWRWGGHQRGFPLTRIRRVCGVLLQVYGAPQMRKSATIYGDLCSLFRPVTQHRGLSCGLHVCKRDRRPLAFLCRAVRSSFWGRESKQAVCFISFSLLVEAVELYSWWSPYHHGERRHNCAIATPLSGTFSSPVFV